MTETIIVLFLCLLIFINITFVLSRQMWHTAITKYFSSPYHTPLGSLWTDYDHTIRGLVSKETAVMRRWGVETNVWFINRDDN